MDAKLLNLIRLFYFGTSTVVPLKVLNKENPGRNSSHVISMISKSAHCSINKLFTCCVNSGYNFKL